VIYSIDRHHTPITADDKCHVVIKLPSNMLEKIAYTFWQRLVRKFQRYAMLLRKILR
jgi:hypothetical protein